MIEHVVVMAAGSGKGLEAMTQTRARAMLPLCGRPLIARVMDAYYLAGVRRFTVVVGEREGDAALWLSSSWHKDAKLTFAPQGHKRGTAAALFATRQHLDAPFVIASCDVLLERDNVEQLLNYFDQHPRDAACMVLYQSMEFYEAGSVLLDPYGYVMYVTEEPTWAHQNYLTALPVYGFTPSVLEHLDKAPIVDALGGQVLADILQMMIDEKKHVGGLEVKKRMPLRSRDDLHRATMQILSALGDRAVLNSTLPPSVKISPPVYIDPGVMVGEGAQLGPNLYLERGSIIGMGAVLKEAVVLGVRVGANQAIEGETIYQER